MGDFERVVFTIAPLAIPIVAIIGGITLAIVRTVGQQKIAELERRERIAAIERGLDPSKLPPPSAVGGYEHGNGWGSRSRRAHGLMNGGLVTVAIGISLMILLGSVESDHRHWVVGFFPLLVGVALLVSAWVIWPRGGK
jgi:hypothetical protein